MISDEISNHLIGFLKLEVDKISLRTFEEILEMRDTMLSINQCKPKFGENNATKLLEEILQTFLEELLPKINITKEVEK